MRFRQHLTRTAMSNAAIAITAMLIIAGLAISCDALVSTDVAQCTIDADCEALGPQLSGYLCGPDQVCVVPNQACNSCHGGEDNPAPPRPIEGDDETTNVRVGAHQTHLHDNEVRKAMWCQECHLVPTTVDESEHRDGGPAEVIFGVLSVSGGAQPQWDRDEQRCTNVYCHGATLAGGAQNTPTWTIVDGSQAFCGSCHGVPPLPPHPPSYECAECHPNTITEFGSIDIEAGYHINGKIDVIDVTCWTCHGSENNPAPPRSTSGETYTTDLGVGAHQSHLASTLMRPMSCDDCHITPQTISDPSHLGELPAEVTFGSLATADGAQPVWDRAAATCSGTYCHGATIAGGTQNVPVWNDVDGSQAVCGTCHGLPPPPPHPANTNCVDCHSQTIDANLFLNPETHIDGSLQHAD